jgi:hypothetical protein
MVKTIEIPLDAKIAMKNKERKKAEEEERE